MMKYEKTKFSVKTIELEDVSEYDVTTSCVIRFSQPYIGTRKRPKCSFILIP